MHSGIQPANESGPRMSGDEPAFSIPTVQLRQVRRHKSFGPVIVLQQLHNQYWRGMTDSQAVWIDVPIVDEELPVKDPT